MKQLFKEGKRRCYVCKEIKDLNDDNFYHNENEAGGFQYQCKNCGNNGGIRRKIIEEADFACIKCGMKVEGNYQFFDIDHIKPIRRRGRQLRQGYYYKDKDRGNLQVICPNCHRFKTIAEGYR